MIPYLYLWGEQINSESITGSAEQLDVVFQGSYRIAQKHCEAKLNNFTQGYSLSYQPFPLQNL